MSAVVVVVGIGSTPASADSNQAGKIGKMVEAATSGRTGESAAATGTGSSAIEYRDQLINVQVPKNAHNGVSITGAAGKLTIGLPVTTSAAVGVRTSKGTVVYADRGSAANVAVQTMTEGARVLVTMEDSSVSKEHRFPLTLPVGAELAAVADGSVEIVKKSKLGTAILGNVEAPWAKDAKGNSVETSYRIDGNSLVQTVDTNADTAYPVVADPRVSYGRFIYVRYSKNEVRSQLDYVANQPVFAVFLCAPAIAANGIAAALCAGALGSIYAGLAGEWRAAYNEGKCMEVRWVYVAPAPWGYNRYSC